MYLHILWKENDFQPLDRVNILERYLREVLSSPSDAFAGSFNVKNKITLVSLFIKLRFEQDHSTFDYASWESFCHDYIKRTLVHFDTQKVFDVFIASRIFVQVGQIYHIRYSFLYSYFVAVALANRPSALQDFFAKDYHYRLGSVVEAVSALSVDNAFLVSALTDRLCGYIGEFYSTYVKERFDPLAHALWPDSDNEREAVWEPIGKEIAEGPIEPEKIDIIKSSLTAESRTLNQEVVFRNFSEMEVKLFSTMALLQDALKNSDDVDGALKIRGLEAIYQAQLIILQVGTLLSGIIATRRHFSWGGVWFININPELDKDDQVTEGFSPWVVPAINRSLIASLVSNLASKKLGSVFMSFDNAEAGRQEFDRVLNFCMILSCKPPSWAMKLEDIIRGIGRHQYRLLVILNALRADYRQEINHHADREEIKRLIALIHSKRSMKTNTPGNKAVTKVLGLLEKRRFFENDELSAASIDDQSIQ